MHFLVSLKDVEVGDLSRRIALKQRAVHDFSWFVKNIFPELGIPDVDTFAWGGVSKQSFAASSSSSIRSRCGRHNSPPASSVMDSIFCCSDSSDVSVGRIHPSLRRSSSSSSPRWYHLQSLSSEYSYYQRCLHNICTCMCV